MGKGTKNPSRNRNDGGRQVSKVKRVNSRKKGSRGELELSHFLISNGFDARRGQQFKGTPDSPDIVSDMLDAIGIHIECKRVEAGNLYTWLDQAKRDAGSAVPIVMHRRSDKPWVAILDLEQFLTFIHNTYPAHLKGRDHGNK